MLSEKGGIFIVVYKFFTMGEYRKKEKWINYMCSKGYALKNCNICRFEFEPCIPNEYYYSLELLENLPSSPYNTDFLNYLDDEWNVQYVCQYRNWAFFRRAKSNGKFSLFYNVSKNVSYFKRILTFRCIFILCLFGFAFFSISCSPTPSSDYVFAFLLIIISIIMIIVSIPSFVEYIKLKKLDKT